MQWNPAISKWCWYQLYAPCCGIIWPDTAIFCIISLHYHYLRAGVMPGHCAPSTGSTHPSFPQRARTGQGCLYAVDPQSGFTPCFQEGCRKKAILHGKLHCWVIVLGIRLHFLGKLDHKGSKGLWLSSRHRCTASPDPHCLFVQDWWYHTTKWIIVLVSPVFMKDASGIAHGC